VCEISSHELLTRLRTDMTLSGAAEAESVGVKACSGWARCSPQNLFFVFDATRRNSDLS